jgi:hypothetical protein
MKSIASLPPELLREVMLYLPVHDLLAFSQTSKHNYAVAHVSLMELNIGVFPNQINALLSDMDSSSRTSGSSTSSQRINIILSKRKTKSANLIMFHQNTVAARILHRHAPSLRSLELALWDLQATTADALAKASQLRHLSLRLDHPHARAVDLHRGFWCSSPGSTVWNSLFTAPSNARSRSTSPSPSSSKQSESSALVRSTVFGQLESLTLERAGITDWQLLRLISENPKLREIRLHKCLTITDEFFRELSRSPIGKSRLRVLHFTSSDNPLVDRRILRWIGKLGALEVSLTNFSHFF